MCQVLSDNIKGIASLLNFIFVHFLTYNHLYLLFSFFFFLGGGMKLYQQRRCDSFDVFPTSDSLDLLADFCYKNHLICHVMHCFASDYFTFQGILICENVQCSEEMSLAGHCGVS